jgi:hypothetical protein
MTLIDFLVLSKGKIARIENSSIKFFTVFFIVKV